MNKIMLIPGILCLVYSGLVFFASRGSRFYLVWTGISAGCFFLSAVKASMFPPVLVQGFRILTGISAAVLLVLLILVFSGFARPADREADHLLVLGAHILPDGRPCRSLMRRLETAAEYLKKHPRTRCIVCGGKGPDEPETEAACMKRILIECGIEEERILLEDRSKNTTENIRFAAAFLDKEKETAAIVTNNFHMYRSIKLAKGNGYRKVWGIPAPALLLYQPTNILRECFGIVKDFAAGHF